MTVPYWNPKLHIIPHQGWLNDPNGLCQFRGTYRFYYQYGPDWPEDDLKYWGQYSSADLVHWKDEGTALSPDIPEDRTGVWSGCTYVEHGAASDGGDLMRVYYTGNVKYPGEHDYAHEGREQNTIEVTSEDGVTFSPKRILMRNADYPANCTKHVRDPKVWREQDGSYRMLLGTRLMDDRGAVLVYRSDDGDDWTLHHVVNSQEPFALVWECPNDVRLEGHEYLAVCPQGVQTNNPSFHFQNLWQAGYFSLEAPLDETTIVDERGFVEWDHGFDFYAPQTFVDDAGRTILVGWMGVFDQRYTATPEGMDWCHCFTLPRRLSRGEDGLLRQWPVTEIDGTRGTSQPLEADIPLTLPGLAQDIVLEGITGTGQLTLGDALVVAFDRDTLSLTFSDPAIGAGRDRRTAPIDHLDDLRVIVDGSTVEVYANGGSTVFSTRWFPKSDTLTVISTFDATGIAYELVP